MMLSWNTADRVTFSWNALGRVTLTSWNSPDSHWMTAVTGMAARWIHVYQATWTISVCRLTSGQQNGPRREVVADGHVCLKNTVSVNVDDLLTRYRFIVC